MMTSEMRVTSQPLKATKLLNYLVNNLLQLNRVLTNALSVPPLCLKSYTLFISTIFRFPLTVGNYEGCGMISGENKLAFGRT